MAATATRRNIMVMHGSNGRTMETGQITFDTDATVEVDTSLKYIENWSFGEAVSGGSLDLPSLDETYTDGQVAVDDDGQVTVDTAANSTRTFSYCFIGY